jgi:hypothetical protein
VDELTAAAPGIVPMAGERNNTSASDPSVVDDDESSCSTLPSFVWPSLDGGAVEEINTVGRGTFAIDCSHAKAGHFPKKQKLGRFWNNLVHFCPWRNEPRQSARSPPGVQR